MKRIIHFVKGRQIYARSLTVLLALALMALAFGITGSGNDGITAGSILMSIVEDMAIEAEPTEVESYVKDGITWYVLTPENNSVNLRHLDIWSEGRYLDRVTFIDPGFLVQTPPNYGPSLLNLPEGGAASGAIFAPSWVDPYPEGCASIADLDWNRGDFGGVEWVNCNEDIVRLEEVEMFEEDFSILSTLGSWRWAVSKEPGNGYIGVMNQKYNIGFATEVKVVEHEGVYPTAEWLVVDPAVVEIATGDAAEVTFSISEAFLEEHAEEAEGLEISLMPAAYVSSDQSVAEPVDGQQNEDGTYTAVIEGLSQGRTVITVAILATVTDPNNPDSNSGVIAFHSLEVIVGEAMTWEDLRAAINAAPANTPTTIEIKNNMTAGSVIQLPGNRNITLVGASTITQETADQRHFIVASGSSLTLGNGVVLCGKDDTVVSGGVQVSNGLFTLAGGTICHNHAAAGGGVDILANGRMVMANGRIHGNTATGNGGGLRVLGSFQMNDGAVENNSAAGNGGGVLVNGGTFEMGNGTIANNSATGAGGGIDISAEGKVVLTNGSIQNNKATGTGGGLRVVGLFQMNGGSIEQNYTSASGGGLLINGISGGTFEMNAGLVADNTAENTGGGAHFTNNGKFAQRGGEIRDNIPNDISGNPVMIP